MPLLNTSWRQLVHDYTQREDLRYEVGGEFLAIRFSEEGRTLTVSFYCSEDFFSMVMADDRFIDEGALALAVAAANRFNNEYKIPKLYVYQNDAGQHDFRGEWHIPATMDIDQKAFDEVMKWAMLCLGSMFEWLKEQYGL
jgi:hypothetical protein